jgi:DNA-binding MarR family transcriptional regulator
MLELESSISVQVSVLAKLLDRRLARLVVDRFGMTVAEYRVLAQVMLHPRSTVRAIAERTFVDKAQVSRAAAALEAGTFITRDMLDHDRRSPVFTITRSGRALLNRIIPLRQAQEDEIVAGLDRADVQRLQVLLPALIDSLGDGPESRGYRADRPGRADAVDRVAKAVRADTAARPVKAAKTITRSPRRQQVPSPRKH